MALRDFTNDDREGSRPPGFEAGLFVLDSLLGFSSKVLSTFRLRLIPPPSLIRFIFSFSRASVDLVFLNSGAVGSMLNKWEE